MSGTPPRNLPPLLIVAAPAGITTLWVLPVIYGRTWQEAGIAAAVVFIVVLLLSRLPGWFASGAKKAASKAKKKANKKKDDEK
ncbi:hypothetical protein [Streptomyces olivaceus]|uniref:hypothetical protein n=1 Tax=Streptomyces olivaceus TaxID=47716 RepID=UPI0022EDBED6|nr:hypothetical protein [Streptomyces olivaceus]GHI97969.1 hypothetical protein TPA0905_74400 [Streptomyces olivaceus]